METLQDAQDKLESTVDLIAELEGTEFPHPHAKDALLLIRQIIESRLGDLKSFDEDAAEAVVRSYCIQATSDISDALEILGFIINSTSIRNSFEVYQNMAGKMRQGAVQVKGPAGRGKRIDRRVVNLGSG